MQLTPLNSLLKTFLEIGNITTVSETKHATKVYQIACVCRRPLLISGSQVSLDVLLQNGGYSIYNLSGSYFEIVR